MSCSINCRSDRTVKNACSNSARNRRSGGKLTIEIGLRATYPAVGGRKVIDVFVYRQKTASGLDNTPYVSGTNAGYVQSDGTIDNPSSPRFPR